MLRVPHLTAGVFLIRHYSISAGAADYAAHMGKTESRRSAGEVRVNTKLRALCRSPSLAGVVSLFSNNRHVGRLGDLLPGIMTPGVTRCAVK